jgi:hypothetical protein
MHDSPSRLMRFESAVKHDPAVDRWFETQPLNPGGMARPWFDLMRNLGDDVRELLHDSHPTACVGDAAFGYVNAFTAHVNVGFFLGAWLDDPAGLLEGTGKRLRHVKLRPGQEPDAAAFAALIENAYRDMRERLRAGALYPPTRPHAIAAALGSRSGPGAESGP